MTQNRLSDWQRQVLADLAAIAAAFPGNVRMVGRRRIDQEGRMKFRLRLRTAGITQVRGALRLEEQEVFIVTVWPTDLVPPEAAVDHLRFLHHAHVLQGQRLCLYLDPAREWDPVGGFGGFLDRLVEWLDDAGAGRFDAQTALYHAVGGVLHVTAGAPTLVVRQKLRRRRAQSGWLLERTPHRFDLVVDRREEIADATHMPIVTLDADLPFGAGLTLGDLSVTMDNPYVGHAFARPIARAAPIPSTFLSVLGSSAIRNPDGTPQMVALAGSIRGTV